MDKVEELEPTRLPEPKEPEDTEAAKPDPADEPDPYEGKSQADVADELNGQMHLFDD